MVNTIKSYFHKNCGTSAASIYACPPSTQVTIIGLSVANTIDSSVASSVYITRSAVNYYLVRNAPVPVGGSLVIIGGDQKVVLQPGDVLKIEHSLDNSGDCVASLLEITQ